MFKGIDVSSYQGIIDWESVNKEIDFAILRCGYGDDSISQDDAYFIRNADECTRLGIPFGVYIFCYAKNWENIKSEVSHVLRMIKRYSLSYPVFLDLEDADTIGSLEPHTIGEYAEYFCSEIKNAGYYPAIYANKYWFSSILTDRLFENWDKWVAQYHTECTYNGSYTMWQYTSDGNVSGINGRVDMNICYVDYPSIIGGLTQPPASDQNESSVKTPAGNSDYEYSDLYSYTHSVGDTVKYNSIYSSSSSSDALTPVYTSGTITSIAGGARNPYLINDGTGWINDDCIIKESISGGNASENRISKGSIVRFTGSTDYYGTPVTSWHDTYVCDEPDNDRVVLRYNGCVFAAVNINDIIPC